MPKLVAHIRQGFPLLNQERRVGVPQIMDTHTRVTALPVVLLKREFNESESRFTIPGRVNTYRASSANCSANTNGTLNATTYVDPLQPLAASDGPQEGEFMIGGAPLGSHPLGSPMLLLLSPQLPTLPSVLLQALVTTGPRIDDPENKGHLIEAVGPAWLPLLEILKRVPGEIFKLSSRQFEELIAASYEKAGFDRVILTPHSGDSGRDVIAEKSGWFSVRIVDQAKAFGPAHVVTADDVRALGHVLAADRAASKGVVTTTSTFAPRISEDPLIAPFLPTRIELVDGKDLLKRLDSLR